MTHEEILKKAIEKAVKNGYQAKHYEMAPIDRVVQDIVGEMVLKWDEHYALIFSHDFAKAFFGDSMVEQGDCGHIYTNNQYHTCEENDGGIPMFSHGDVAWKLHLKKMVLEEDPITYLSTFL